MSNSVMPKGVERWQSLIITAEAATVSNSVMPKGVEHYEGVEV